VDTTVALRMETVKILRRPKGVRSRDRPLPRGVDRSKVVAILTGSIYQVAARVRMDDRYVLHTWVIVDTESGVSLVRQELLPPEVSINPVERRPR